MKTIIPAYQLANVVELKDGKKVHSFAIVKNANAMTCCIANRIADVLAGVSILNYRRPVIKYEHGIRTVIGMIGLFLFTSCINPVDVPVCDSAKRAVLVALFGNDYSPTPQLMNQTRFTFGTRSFDFIEDHGECRVISHSQLP
jgi:hypothetical protein